MRGDRKDEICDFCFHKLKLCNGDKTAPALYKLITGLLDTLKNKGGGPEWTKGSSYNFRVKIMLPIKVCWTKPTVWDWNQSRWMLSSCPRRKTT